MKQEMMGLSWTIRKSLAPRFRQITMPAPHHSIFTGRMLLLTPNQQCQSTERQAETMITKKYKFLRKFIYLDIDNDSVPSSRHHLSYDDCLEDKRESGLSVLCVYDSCAQ